MPKARILVLDPDVSWTLALSEALLRDDCEVFSANTVEDALLLLQARNIEVLVAEINLPRTQPASFLEQVRQVHPGVTLIICTAAPSVTQAVV